jgi:hypothetical protein
MRKTVIRAFFFLCNLNAFAQDEGNLVKYVSQIDWTFFRGVQDADSLGARISTSIYLEVVKTSIWNGTITFKAGALMNPCASWVRPGYFDGHTLQHEQTHFNITEVCARGLQGELNQMKIKLKDSPIIQSTFSKWQAKMEDLQKQYDLETKGGRDSFTQELWYQRILKELR